MAEVASRLDLDRTDAKVLTVAGTNGKGSSVAFSEAILIKLESLLARIHLHIF